MTARMRASIQNTTITITHGNQTRTLDIHGDDDPTTIVMHHAIRTAKALARRVELGIALPTGEQWWTISEDGTPTKTLPPSDTLTDRHQVIVVTSPAGGVGTTTVATHLADALGQHHADQTILIDANPQGSSHLIQPEPVKATSTITTIADQPNKIRRQATLMPNYWYVQSHPDQTQRMTTSVTMHAATQFRISVIDTNTPDALLAITTQLVIVATPTADALYRTDAWIDLLIDRGYTHLIETATLALNDRTPAPRFKPHTLREKAISHFNRRVRHVTPINHIPSLSTNWRTLTPSQDWQTLATQVPHHPNTS